MAVQHKLENPFDQFQQLVDKNGARPALGFLEQKFRSEKKFFQLFEVLKMQVRNQMGLPLIYGLVPDELDTSQQRELEDGLLAACAQVGKLLIEDGRLEEGWMYLQPAADREMIEKIVCGIPVTAENTGAIIEIAFSQSAAPAYGYSLLLKQFGTCNGITSFETQAARFDVPTQKSLAEILLRHFYAELCSTLVHCVEREGKLAGQPENLSHLLTEHPWLIAGGAHHLDPTHLASVVKIARAVERIDDLQQAFELVKYGSGLHPDFQYASPPPFEATYFDHQIYFDALLGNNIDTAIEHFESKCETVDTQQFGGVAFETLVDLLVRFGRRGQAIDVMTKQVLGKFEPLGIAPPIFHIAQTPAELAVVQEFFRRQDDLLSFGITVLQLNR